MLGNMVGVGINWWLVKRWDIYGFDFLRVYSLWREIVKWVRVVLRDECFD